MFFSQIGYQAFYLIQQLIIREEQKELAFSLLPESSLEKIKDNQLIDWEEEGKEFYLNNNMYDVVKTSIIRGEKIYFVVNDKKESEVLKQFGNIIRYQQENNQHKKGSGVEVKFQLPVFTLLNTPAFHAENIPTYTYYLLNEKVNGFFISDILIPPPQC
jgi:hypothetical protein